MTVPTGGSDSKEVKPPKGDQVVVASSSTTTASMAAVTVWPPQAYDGKVRFDVWETLLDMYISARGFTENSDKVAALLQHIGTATLEKIIDWTSPDKPQTKSYDDLIALLNTKFAIKKNVTALRFKFFTEKQRDEQSLQEYLAHMTQLYGQCSVKEMKPENFGVLAILQGLQSNELRQYLMNPGNNIDDMAKLQDLALNFEQSREAAKAFKGVDGNVKPHHSINVVGKGMKCRYCGDNHQPGKEKCPAKDKECSKCGKMNHFAKVCKSDTRKKQQNLVETCSSGSLNGIYGVLNVSSRPEGNIPPSIVEAKLDGTSVQMQYDTGSGFSIISKKVWHTIGKPKMHSCNTQLKSYNQRITVIGQCSITVQIGTELKQQWIIVVPKGESIFGRNWIHAFNTQMQRRCIASCDRKRGELERKHTVNHIHHTEPRATKYLDRSSYLQNKIIKEAVHDPMQGKEIGLSGKDTKQRNDRFSSQTTHAKTPEDTVLKGIKLQKEKPCKFLTGKGRPRHPKQKHYRVSDQADLYFKHRMQHEKDTVAFANSEKTSLKQDSTPTDRHELKAFTGSNEANHHDRRTKILKNSSYKSGGVDRYKFKLY